MLAKLASLTLLSILILHLSASATKSVDKLNIDDDVVQFISRDDLKDLLKIYPNSHPLPSRISKKNTKGRAASNVTLSYQLGARVNGDVCVVHKTKSVQFDAPRLVNVLFSYPPAGNVGNVATISMVDIIVHQSTSEGQAFVLAGGIGQKEIQFVIEANNTEFLEFNTKMYGYY